MKDQYRQALTDAGFLFEEKNDGNHFIIEGTVGYVDLWPGTGNWICRTSRLKGFGWRALRAHLEAQGEHRS